MSLDFDGFKISVATLVDIHNDLIKEVELIDSMCSRYTVSKARLCLASNIVAIRDTLSKLDNMVEIDNEPITHQGLIMGKKRYWHSIIGPIERDELPDGADAPMRSAVQNALEKMVGHDAKDCYSGWDISEGHAREIIELSCSEEARQRNKED